MKICWENLIDIKFNRSKNFMKKGNLMIEMDSCTNCGEPYLAYKSQIDRGKGKYCSTKCSGPDNYKKYSGHDEITRKKISIASKKRQKIKENNYWYGKRGKYTANWKGGACKYAYYKTYADKIEYAEEIRKNTNFIEVKCAYCGKWYMPSVINVINRIGSLQGTKMGENRFYCSDNCKKECPIYGKIKWPKGFKISSSREVQPELRQLVFERDNWTCQKCGNNKSLHCHHIEGIRWEPLESADMDKCITLCKKCHKKAHELPDCRYVDMQCKGLEVMSYR